VISVASAAEVLSHHRVVQVNIVHSRADQQASGEV